MIRARLYKGTSTSSTGSIPLWAMSQSTTEVTVESSGYLTDRGTPCLSLLCILSNPSIL